MSKEGRSANAPNILVFGQTGSGKSSLINMLAGKVVAKVSSDPDGCTIASKSYDIPKDDKTYTFWDTCGLNEGEKGNVPAQTAANDLGDLLNRISVSLIIYCVHGHRFLDIVRANYDMVCRVAKVPIVLVVTGLEQQEDMDQWWTEHEKVVKRLNLSFKGHACVTTIKGRNNVYEKEYQKSTEKVWKLVETHCDSAPSFNIIVFGEASSGKSSIVNMIVGQPVAEVSRSPVGSAAQLCTFQHKRYAAVIDNTHFNIYDTVGLNEGEQGRVPHWKAVHELYTLIRSLDGVSLLIYCMRGRIKENSRANWILFHKVLCAKKVPIIAVETGLEHEENLDGRGALLKKVLDKYGMVPKAIACIVSVRGKKNEYEERFDSSQSQLRQLILESYKKKPWSMTTDDWIGHIYKTTYSTKFCVCPDVRMEVGNMVDEYIEEVGMTKDESDKLKSTLLGAEKDVNKASR